MAQVKMKKGKTVCYVLPENVEKFERMGYKSADVKPVKRKPSEERETADHVPQGEDAAG